MPLTDSISPVNARPSLRAADEYLVTLAHALVLGTEADAGQPGDWPVQSAHSRTQGVVMHAAGHEKGTCQRLLSSKCIQCVQDSFPQQDHSHKQKHGIDNFSSRVIPAVCTLWFRFSLNLQPFKLFLHAAS